MFIFRPNRVGESPLPSSMTCATASNAAAAAGHNEGGEVSVEDARAEAVDADTGDTDAAKIPTVEHGLWTPSRFGTLIRCRQWRVLGGGFRFFLDGRLMHGSTTCFFWISLVIYLISVVAVFIYFETSAFDEWDSILVALLGVVTIYNLVAVGCTDPGCLPKALEEERLNNLVQYQLEKEPGADNVEKVMTINGEEELCDFCTTCCHFKPKRTVHCKICGFCIDRLSCHCFLFGTCVGQRNYGHYVKFLFFANNLFGTTLAVSIYNLVTLSARFGFVYAAGVSPTTFVLLAGFLLPIPFGPCLMIYELVQHFLFALLDLSHIEAIQLKTDYFNGMKGKTVRDGIRFMAANFYRRVIAKPPKSLIAPRNYVTVRAIPRARPCQGDTKKKIASLTPRPGTAAASRLWICRRGLDVNAKTRVKSASASALESDDPNRSHAGADTACKPKAGASISAILNPFIDEHAPKTRGVYTLPSHCLSTSASTRTNAQSLKEKFTFEFLRKSFPSISSGRPPVPRTEAAEPARTPAQIRQHQHELAAVGMSSVSSGQSLRNV